MHLSKKLKKVGESSMSRKSSKKESPLMAAKCPLFFPDCLKKEQKQPAPAER